MRPRTASLFVLLASLSCLLPPDRLAAPPPSAYHTPEAALERASKSAAETRGRGVKEVVPEKFAARYAGWKQEFLS
ncbi:MAG TPA: hypothetical protein VGV38_05810, partial [Pyrinomonadaceae bacterium]|nr:hypothetical protein [Pyrinomonadaceae bacterium]